ncbi:MAG: glycosyltransferase, partial [Planctomycetota bacterium]
MPAPTVSILLPTLDASRDLARLLPALDSQALPGAEIERIAIDSSSSDDTRELLERAGFQVHRIERRDFGHGRTRNELARRARGGYLLFLSQDAVPTAPDFVERMIEPFADERIGGVTARVLPNPDDDALTARTVLAAPAASDAAATRAWKDPGAYASMSGPERLDLLRFNNVASCIRRDVHAAIAFPEVPFGEDFAWAARAMAAGWALHHTPDAAVLHAHRYGPKEAYARYRVDAVFHREFNGWAIRPSFASVLKGIAHELREDFRYARRHGASLRDVLRAPALRVA